MQSAILLYHYFLSVCPSVCRMLILCRNGCEIRQTFSTRLGYYLNPTAVTKFKGEPHQCVKYTGIGKICNFCPKSPFISEAIRYKPIVTMDN